MHITQSIDKLYAEIQPTHLTHSTVHKLSAEIPCTQLSLLYINYMSKFPVRISVYCTLNYMPKFPVLISHVLLYLNYLPKFPVRISHFLLYINYLSKFPVRISNFQEHIKYQILQGLCLYETNL